MSLVMASVVRFFDFPSKNFPMDMKVSIIAALSK